MPASDPQRTWLSCEGTAQFLFDLNQIHDFCLQTIVNGHFHGGQVR